MFGERRCGACWVPGGLLAEVGGHCGLPRASVAPFDGIGRSQVRYNSLMESARCVVLIAHGSRAEGTAADHARLAGELEAAIGTPVIGAFLEITPPDIPTAISQAVDRGARSVVLLPYFLLAGNHTSRDIPEIMDRARSTHPGVTLTMTAPLGPDRRLVEICVDRARAAGVAAGAGG